MKLSVCMESVFNGQDIVKSLEAVKAAGYDTFEFWGWKDKNIDALKEAMDRLDLKLSAFCTRFTSLVDRKDHVDYLMGLRESIAVAKKLGCSNLVTQCGDDIGVPRDEQRAAAVDCLKQCAPLLEEAGINLLLEPLNTKIDHTGTYLDSSAEAYNMILETDSPRINMLFDIYHQQITEGDILRNIERYITRIGHIHVAANPGRHELYNCELNYANIFERLLKLGYNGYIGLEYFPSDPVEKGLKHVLDLFYKCQAGVTA